MSESIESVVKYALGPGWRHEWNCPCGVCKKDGRRSVELHARLEDGKVGPVGGEARAFFDRE